MSLIGFGVGICAEVATTSVLTPLSMVTKSGVKFIDKVVVPIGIIAISSTVGSIVANKVDNDIDEIKESINVIKEMKNREDEIKAKVKEAEEKYMKYKEESEPVTHNVFDEEVSDNG